MKILFSADWHLKLGQKNVPREWQKNRYERLFSKLHELEDEADIHIIGGDIFDKLPNTEELALYFEFIAGVKIPTYIYDGNHEATKKGHTFLHHLANVTNKINNNATILNGITNIHNIDFIPYTDLKTFKPKDFSNEILCTHVRGSIPPHVIPEIDLDLLNRWKIVLAGDLHSYSNSQRNILYPGSPLSITFHRSPVANGVIIFDTESYYSNWVDLKLPQLIRKTVTSEEEIIKTDYDHTIYEITGNIKELSNIDTTLDIIDKKVVNKRQESLLDLHNKTVQEELVIYLKDILLFSKEDTDEIVNTFNDYYKEYNME
jgi:DNA repair exonuclease SbcCD nuclease subunit